MLGSYWTPEAELTQSFGTSPLATLALAYSLNFTNDIDTPPKTTYLQKRTEDITTHSLKARGALQTKTKPTQLGLVQQEHVVIIQRQIGY